MKFIRKKQRNHCRPNIQTEEGTESIIQIDQVVEDFLINTRRLLVTGDINELLSTHICSYLQWFSIENKPVFMYINSPGGCVVSGYAIIDQMLACNYPICTIVRGQAYSMGAMIAAFGTKGYRYATPNSSFMLHSIIISNQLDSLERHNVMIDYVNKDYRQKVRDLARRTKLTVKQLTDMMSNTRWMTPKQATVNGLIDGIWTQRMEQAVNRGF